MSTKSKEHDMTIDVSEDLGLPARSPMRFCAVVVGDTDHDRAGFGPTEIAALALLIERFPKDQRAALAGATIERIAVRGHNEAAPPGSRVRTAPTPPEEVTLGWHRPV
jgi:hypothetical protein